MPQFKSTNFCYNRPKIKLFLHKNCKILERWGLRPQISLPPAVGGVSPKPPMASCGRDCSYLVDNLFVVVFYCLFDVLSTLALMKCLIVWQYFCNVGGNNCAYSIKSAAWKSCPSLPFWRSGTPGQWTVKIHKQRNFLHPLSYVSCLNRSW